MMLRQVRLAAALLWAAKHIVERVPRVSFAHSFCLLILLSGCSTFAEGPERLFNYDSEQSNIRAQIGAPNFDRYFSLSGPARRVYRNDYVLTRMYAMDLAYTKYEANLTTDEQAGDLIAAATTIALTTTSSLLTPGTTAQILTGTAGALTGVKAAYNEKVLLRNSIQLLQTQMRANRALVSSRIIQRLGSDDASYPLPLALSDLEEYYRAGTLTGAAIKAQATVSDSEQVAEQARQSVIVYNVRNGPGQVALRNAITAGGKVDPVVFAKVQAKLPPGVNIGALTADPNLEPVAARIARELGYL
jgi:hypothetical protein